MDYKVLINKNNKITKSIINNIKFIKVKNYLGKDILIEKKTYDMYNKLKEFLKSIGIEIFIENSYRSLEEQENIFYKYKNIYGIDYANNYIAPKGYSEHHTGLCIDIVLKNNDKLITSNNDLLKCDEVFKKIHSYLKDYGFILRYPKDKEKVTGYKYEPWHIRYVGYNTANIIYNENLSLEEYHEKYNINGVLLVNKSVNMTSRDIDNIISKKFDTKKVGHTGTLDPLATGVLIVLIGNATKINEDINNEFKEYIATVKVGIKTDTLDIIGKIIEENSYFEIENIEEILKSFEKTYFQEVPKYSAVKINGKKLYEYARSNKPIVLPKKKVTIKKIELLNKTRDTFTFKCLVSKGTYIRSLIRDIGDANNILLTMTDLVRTKEAGYTIKDCYTIDEINNDKYKIIDIDEFLKYPVVNIYNTNILKKIKNGAIIENIYNVKDKIIFKSNRKVLAIYEVFDDKLKSYKNFN